MRKDTQTSSLIEYSLMYDDDFASWGNEEVAYIKRGVLCDSQGWGIYDAEGTRIGFAENRQVASILITQNDLTPVSVH